MRSKNRMSLWCDDEGLYPVIVDVEAAVLCYNVVMESHIKFTNINYRKGIMYIAMHLTPAERRMSPLRRVLLIRTARGGVMPGVSADPRKQTNWSFPKIEITELEERMVVATIVQIGVIVNMNTHQYSINGRTFLQMAGGPIGLRVTGAIACVVMNVWVA